MSNLALLRNVSASPSMQGTSLQDLMKRLQAIEGQLSEADRSTLDTAIGNAFNGVSKILDRFELDKAEATVNRLRGNSSARGTPSRGLSGFRVPKAID